MSPDPQTRLLDALRGEAGQPLRRLLLDEHQAEQQALATDAADAALISRLRAAGAFRARRRRWPAWRGLSLRWMVALPSLATALGAAFLVLQPLPPLPEDAPASQWRGAAQVQRIKAADPVAWAAELQALFARHQQPLRRVDLPARAGIELQARVPTEALALREGLAARGVVVPANGQLLLRVSAP